MLPKEEKTNMIWDEHKGMVTFEWLEAKNGTDEHHYLRRNPVTIILHPRKGTIYRAYFKGAQPAWIERFARKFGYQTNETSTKLGKGWWIADYGNANGYINLSTPSVEGMIGEWFQNLPDECRNDEKRLVDNIDIVKKIYFTFQKS